MITGRLRYDKEFKSITAKVEADLLNHCIEQSRVTAEEIVSYIRRNWQHSIPSEPYEPPAMRSGVLDEGITVEKQGRISGRFGGTFESVTFIRFDTSDNNRGQYALAVEDGNRITQAKPRPFLEPAMEKYTDDYKDNLKKWKWRNV